MALTASVRLLDVPFHLDRPFTYLPPADGSAARVGSVVRIPFGPSNRLVLGIVTAIGEGDGADLKTIREVLPDRCSLSGEMFGLALFLSDYTLCTLGEAARTLLPPTLFSRRLNVRTERTYTPVPDAIAERLSDAGRGKIRSEEVRTALEALRSDPAPKKAEELPFTPAQLRSLVERGLFSVSEREVIRNPYAALSLERDAAPIALSRAQTAAYEKILSLPADKPRAALLHGVTGSGKTKVMLKLLDGILAEGKTAIVMVPEIALTPQTVGIFCRRYGERVAVIHSSLGAGERFDAWRRIAAGEVDLVIGTRSAVFAPLPRLGMIVIDEEHEHTYKSESDPKYHARDVASYRCGVNNALLLLASATPSLESYTKAKNGQYTLVELKERYGGARLPETEIVDMREELRHGNTSPISDRLAAAVRETVERGEQAILFLNRRGYNTALQCRACGEPIVCPRCSISLTYHTGRDGGKLLCHSCGYRARPPRACPSCGADALSYLGFGTQKIEAELSASLSGCRVMRMDADTATGKQAYDRMLDAFRRGDADVLLGTQMVAKGHDFPRVTLVGVLSADSSLYVNDFRAAERTFCLLTQVIGRAGRAERPGRALIQTYSPGNEILSLACRQDYPAFYEAESALRRETVFPPFCDVAVLLLSSADETALFRAAKDLSDRLLSLAEGEYHDLPLTAFGPFEAQVYKVNDRYRLRMILKCRNSPRLRALLRTLTVSFADERKVILSVDINPLSV